MNAAERTGGLTIDQVEGVVEFGEPVEVAVAGGESGPG